MENNWNLWSSVNVVTKNSVLKRSGPSFAMPYVTHKSIEKMGPHLLLFLTQKKGDITHMMTQS